ncbi:MAG: hypothetical protein BMS9Abin32_605 [Gammaproteobacteria bacterium]|nr:MAG: hypothetical protein BMS9Abin32_605 [Gammaproteobacteria bacterium]
MKNMLGFAFFMLFLAGFAFVFMQGKQADSPRTESARFKSITGIEWRPVAIGKSPVSADPAMFVRFETGGNIGGRAACNRFFGTWEFTGGEFRIGPLGATSMACPEPAMQLEREFLQAIEQTKHLLLKPGSMHLLGTGNAALAELVPAGRAADD